MNSKFVLVDSNMYEVIFVGSRAVAVNVKVERQVTRHRLNYWRRVWAVGDNNQSKRVAIVISKAQRA